MFYKYYTEFQVHFISVCTGKQPAQNMLGTLVACRYAFLSAFHCPFFMRLAKVLGSKADRDFFTPSGSPRLQAFDTSGITKC